MIDARSPGSRSTITAGAMSLLRPRVERTGVRSWRRHPHCRKRSTARRGNRRRRWRRRACRRDNAVSQPLGAQASASAPPPSVAASATLAFDEQQYEPLGPRSGLQSCVPTTAQTEFDPPTRHSSRRHALGRAVGARVRAGRRIRNDAGGSATPRSALAVAVVGPACVGGRGVPAIRALGRARDPSLGQVPGAWRLPGSAQALAVGLAARNSHAEVRIRACRAECTSARSRAGAAAPLGDSDYGHRPKQRERDHHATGHANDESTLRARPHTRSPRREVHLGVCRHVPDPDGYVMPGPCNMPGLQQGEPQRVSTSPDMFALAACPDEMPMRQIPPSVSDRRLDGDPPRGGAG